MELFLLIPVLMYRGVKCLEGDFYEKDNWIDRCTCDAAEY